MNHPNVTYPLIIDPTITLDNNSILWNGYITNETNSTGSTFVRNSNPNNNIKVGNLLSLAGPNGTTTIYGNGDIDWNVSSIPNNADILNVTLAIYTETSSNVSVNISINITQMIGNSFTYPNTEGDCQGNCHFYIDINNGSFYNSSIVETERAINLTLSQQAVNDLEAALSSDKFSTGLLGFWDVGKEVWIKSRDANQENKRPILIITYYKQFIVNNSQNCSTLLTNAIQEEVGYSCSMAPTTCVGLNADLNITNTGILNLDKDCEIFFNTSTDGQFSFFIEGKLNLTGANITATNSTNKFNLYSFTENPLTQGSYGNLSFANIKTQTNITDTNLKFKNIDIEKQLVLLNSSDIDEYIIDGGSLERKFRLNVSVYSLGSTVSFATVTARNRTNDLIFSKLTDMKGSIFHNLTQYIDAGTGKSYWSNYVVNVTKLGYISNGTIFNLTADTELKINLPTTSILEVSSTETLPQIYARVNNNKIFNNLSDSSRLCRYVSTISINVTSVGTLIIEGCTLEMNSTSNDGQYDLIIVGQLIANYSNITRSISHNYEFILDRSSNSQILNSFISFTGATTVNGRRGLVLKTNNITFDNNTLYRAYSSNVELFANRIELKNSRFLGGALTDYNLFVLSNNSKIINSNISGAVTDIAVEKDNNFTVLNSNYSTHSIRPGAFIYRQWYVDVLVRDNLGNNLTNANVSFYNNVGNLIISVLTNSSGNIIRQNVTEYSVNGTARYYRTNYTINASKDGYITGTQSLNFTTNANLTFILTSV